MFLSDGMGRRMEKAGGKRFARIVDCVRTGARQTTGCLRTQHKQRTCVLVSPTRPQRLGLLLTKTQKHTGSVCMCVYINMHAYVRLRDSVCLKPQHSAGQQLLRPAWSALTSAASRPRLTSYFQSLGCSLTRARHLCTAHIN